MISNRIFKNSLNDIIKRQIIIYKLQFELKKEIPGINYSLLENNKKDLFLKN